MTEKQAERKMEHEIETLSMQGLGFPRVGDSEPGAPTQLKCGMAEGSV